MITISLPPDIEGPLIEEAQRRGTTPELLVLDSLRTLFVPTPDSDEPTGEDATLSDFLAGYIGTVEGSREAFSDNCGPHFAEGWPRNSSEDVCDTDGYRSTGCARESERSKPCGLRHGDKSFAIWPAHHDMALFHRGHVPRLPGWWLPRPSSPMAVAYHQAIAPP